VEGLVKRLDGAFGHWADGFVEQVPKLIAALLCLVLTVLVARRVRRWAERGLRRTSAEPHVGVVVATLAYYGVVTIGLVVALSLGGVNLALLVGSLGLATVALGFALQDIVSNFAAGIALLLEHPFTRGDHIAMGDTEGTVEDIRVRATQLRTPDGQRVVVPNKLLFTNVVTNASASVHRRLEVLLEVPEGQDPAKARELLPAAAARVGGVFANPAPQVLIEDFGEGAVSLRLRFWVDPHADDLLRVRSEVLEAARTTLSETPS
jgi:small conductance mechanosensitive channel